MLLTLRHKVHINMNLMLEFSAFVQDNVHKNTRKHTFSSFFLAISTAVLRKQTAHALTFLIACASVSVYIWHSQVECMRSWIGSFLRMHVRTLQVFRIQREAVLRTPSLPIPLQVHMCFISRPAHWTVNSSGGLAWGICAARGWERAIAGNKRQASKESPCSDSVSCHPLKPPASFSSFWTPRPPSFAVPLGTCVSLRVPFWKLVYSASSFAST